MASAGTITVDIEALWGKVVTGIDAVSKKFDQFGGRMARKAVGMAAAITSTKNAISGFNNALEEMSKDGMQAVDFLTALQTGLFEAGNTLSLGLAGTFRTVALELSGQSAELRKLMDEVGKKEKWAAGMEGLLDISKGLQAVEREFDNSFLASKNRNPMKALFEDIDQEAESAFNQIQAIIDKIKSIEGLDPDFMRRFIEDATKLQDRLTGVTTIIELGGGKTRTETTPGQIEATALNTIRKELLDKIKTPLDRWFDSMNLANELFQRGVITFDEFGKINDMFNRELAQQTKQPETLSAETAIGEFKFGAPGMKDQATKKEQEDQTEELKTQTGYLKSIDKKIGSAGTSGIVPFE